jgi:hypothetical protein
MIGILTFRNMITPTIVQFIFWVGLLGLVIGLLIGTVAADTIGGRLLLVFWLFISPVCWRVLCEILLVLFHIRTTLIEIRDIAAGTAED